MIQAMKILQLGALDLQERIEQELVENPMLEETPAAGEEPAGDDSGEGAADVASSTEVDREAVQRMLDDLERLDRDYGDGSRMVSGDGEEGDRKMQALANTPDSPHTMAEALSEELAFIDLNPRDRAIAEFLIFSLDDRGYLPEGLDELAEQCPTVELPVTAAAPASDEPSSDGSSPDRSSPDDERTDGREESEGGEPCPGGPVSVDELFAVLERLRELIHPALGAIDLREALLLQIDHFDHQMPLLRTIVADHLEDVEHNRLPRIAKATGHPIEAIKDSLEHLRRLDPAPGADYQESVATVIVPDVIVEEFEGEFIVRLERERLPRLQLSPTYRKLLKDAARGDQTEVWLKKRLESARWFIDAVSQRQSTLERIAKVIFVRQRPFLDRGLSALQPLRMQEVADEVHVHISTVSRAVNGKYAQTPRGIFPLKYFFSGGTAMGNNGEVASQISIQQRIKELVEAEDSSKPFSDEEIANRLQEAEKIRIARRTVTKYRKILGIPSSSQRRAF